MNCRRIGPNVGRKRPRKAGKRIAAQHFDTCKRECPTKRAQTTNQRSYPSCKRPEQRKAARHEDKGERRHPSMPRDIDKEGFNDPVKRNGKVADTATPADQRRTRAKQSISLQIGERGKAKKVWAEIWEEALGMENVSTSQRTRHIDIRWAYVRTFLQEGFLKVIFVKSENNLSDGMTKNTNSEVYEKHTPSYVIDKEEFVKSTQTETGRVSEE